MYYRNAFPITEIELTSFINEKTAQAQRCKRLIPLFLKMIAALKESPFKQLATLGKTLYEWREVVRMWRFTKNNGITKGFHRKMKLIQRRANGWFICRKPLHPANPKVFLI
jgi:hypothetical protein